MDIQVGEYIRTPYFNIEKVERIDKAEKPIYANTVITNNTFYTMNWLLNNNVKHSKNIIDLIEVGDYVNGYKILEIYEPLAPDDEKILDIGYGMAIFVENIKSIVTKESFKSMEYKLEE